MTQLNHFMCTSYHKDIGNGNIINDTMKIVYDWLVDKGSKVNTNRFVAFHFIRKLFVLSMTNNIKFPYCIYEYMLFLSGSQNSEKITLKSLLSTPYKDILKSNNNLGYHIDGSLSGLPKGDMLKQNNIPDFTYYDRYKIENLFDVDYDATKSFMLAEECKHMEEQSLLFLRFVFELMYGADNIRGRMGIIHLHLDSLENKPCEFVHDYNFLLNHDLTKEFISSNPHGYFQCLLRLFFPASVAKKSFYLDRNLYSDAVCYLESCIGEYGYHLSDTIFSEKLNKDNKKKYYHNKLKTGYFNDLLYIYPNSLEYFEPGTFELYISSIYCLSVHFRFFVNHDEGVIREYTGGSRFMKLLDTKVIPKGMDYDYVRFLEDRSVVDGITGDRLDKLNESHVLRTQKNERRKEIEKNIYRKKALTSKMKDVAYKKIEGVNSMILLLLNNVSKLRELKIIIKEQYDIFKTPSHEKFIEKKSNYFSLIKTSYMMVDDAIKMVMGLDKNEWAYTHSDMDVLLGKIHDIRSELDMFDTFFDNDDRSTKGSGYISGFDDIRENIAKIRFLTLNLKKATARSNKP